MSFFTYKIATTPLVHFLKTTSKTFKLKMIQISRRVLAILHVFSFFHIFFLLQIILFQFLSLPRCTLVGLLETIMLKLRNRQILTLQRYLILFFTFPTHKSKNNLFDVSFQITIIGLQNNICHFRKRRENERKLKTMEVSGVLLLLFPCFQNIATDYFLKVFFILQETL